ncbi:MAG: hypothetical protein ABFR75_03165 [Acidobacteriota bacterium]
MNDEININFDEGDASIDFSDLEDNTPEDNPETKKDGGNMSVNSAQIFNETLESLSTISGFLAAGVYNSSGDVLSHLDRKGFNFEEIGSLAIELYIAAVSISDKMGLGMCNFVETHTENYIFIHMCVVPGKGAMGVLLESKGNVGLARHQMRKEGAKLVSEFA